MVESVEEVRAKLQATFFELGQGNPYSLKN
jgi:hypothetical protein